MLRSAVASHSLKRSYSPARGHSTSLNSDLSSRICGRVNSKILGFRISIRFNTKHILVEYVLKVAYIHSLKEVVLRYDLIKIRWHMPSSFFVLFRVYINAAETRVYFYEGKHMSELTDGRVENVVVQSASPGSDGRDEIVNIVYKVEGSLTVRGWSYDTEADPLALAKIDLGQRMVRTYKDKKENRRANSFTDCIGHMAHEMTENKGCSAREIIDAMEDIRLSNMLWNLLSLRDLVMAIEYLMPRDREEVLFSELVRLKQEKV